MPNSPVDRPISEVSESSGRVWLQTPERNFQEGWATFTEVDGELVVEIEVAPPEPAAQPAHLHFGTCDSLGGVFEILQNVSVRGTSRTVLQGLTMEDVATGDLSVNLHKSFSDFATFTACGEIPRLEPDLPSAPGDSPDEVPAAS